MVIRFKVRGLPVSHMRAPMGDPSTFFGLFVALIFL
jgi:hypothetical protein